MHVDHQAALCGDLAERGDARGAVGHGPLEMRDAADHVDALVERALEILRRRSASGSSRPAGRRRAAGRYRARSRRFTSSSASTAEQAVVADVDMAADGEQPLRDGEIAIAERPLDTASTVRSGFSSPHSAMPSSSVPDWLSRGRPSDSVASMWKWQSTKGGDTSRPVASMMRPASRGNARLDGDDPAAGAGDVDAGPAVREGGFLDEEIERTGHQRSSLRNGISRLAGARALRETSAMATMVRTKGSIRNT